MSGNHPGNNCIVAVADSDRPNVGLVGKRFYHTQHGFSKLCRIAMRRDLISVGCSDVTYKAAKELIRLYEEKFGTDGEIVIQP